jgi:predicted RNase H-like HicB family nuclease
MTVDEHVALPWTVHGRAVREAPEDAPYYLVTIEEMPGFSIVATTRAEAEGMYPAELREYIEAMVESGRAVPVPPVAA